MTDKPITLPPLPKALSGSMSLFGAKDMDAYARAAVLADRALNATAQGMELPPLPEPAIKSSQTDSTMRVLTVQSFSHDQMDEYGQACHDAGYAAGYCTGHHDGEHARAAAPTAPISAVDAVAGEPVTKVWGVENKTMAAFFATKELAQTFIAGFPLSVSGGMHISAIEVIGATPPRAGSETTASASVHGVMGAEVVDEWVLIAPDGRRFTSDTKIGCMRAETDSRIPPSVQLARIYAAADESELEDRAAIAAELDPHALRAADCPPDSLVVPQYSIRRLLATPAAPSQGGTNGKA